MSASKQSRGGALPLGTIYTTRARLYDRNGKYLGSCLDTPNAIARAFMECPEAGTAFGTLGWSYRSDYGDRMNSYNTAFSFLELKENGDGK